ncbi:hypothetical protein AM499_08735 [Bacillus sp. FJAT-22090]|nr:hypothetical protein AM499_08735 [Bacillus sp. FJAT-22090]
MKSKQSGFPLQVDAFRGLGFSLLGALAPAGSSAQANPAGVAAFRSNHVIITLLKEYFKIILSQYSYV